MSQKRVLLVDDYADALEVWGLYLRSQGYEVLTADDGVTAVEYAHRFLPDLIVLDLELPGISGFEAAVRLRHARDTSSIPLLAATASSGPTPLRRAKDCGFDAIVTKPFDPATLVAEIERLLADAHGQVREHVGVKRVVQNR